MSSFSRASMPSVSTLRRYSTEDDMILTIVCERMSRMLLLGRLLDLHLALPLAEMALFYRTIVRKTSVLLRGYPQQVPRANHQILGVSTRSPLIFGGANSTQASCPTYTVKSREKCNSRPTTNPNKGLLGDGPSLDLLRIPCVLPKPLKRLSGVCLVLEFR